jgi:hypothetical protein
LTLLTSAFLVDTSANLSLAGSDPENAALHHLWTARGLGILWAFCVTMWIGKLFGIIKVVRPIQAEPGPH